ncbi:Re/Si-specific NAD(P)(+) transhydrogenase subunit alpha [Chroococcus sp. FPU101]|uniref:Re/Si-specific NAD(P)(+) transhydrogenase subunit alpha n=1 Tax=Chroococcus sp. FPU101 TaxID=1974212 RepID=UPI001A8E73DD|nr:Re/Si-specific NAD(P)(+) transhydrogenase subunit alpha [Chroococcus sp. FPU101]GFE68951.1 putative nicotinamide nucleotide transhydrogenase, subunit alpha 1 (A1) [Chroococcus sp. FPU101]
MKIAVAKESDLGELRVALVPEIVARLVKQGLDVMVQTDAGTGSFFTDEAYSNAGATLVSDPRTLAQEADIVLKVSPPSEDEINTLKPGTVLISFLNPLRNPERIKQLADRQITAFSMELIPRSSRAQSMDALSSQANIAGYKAAILASAYLPKLFPMMTTAAGTIPPAKVLVLGAGVAGLQAIATARRLGAVVEAFDIRPQVKEEVQSVGAKFIEVNIEEDTVAHNGYAKEVNTNTQDRIREVLTEHIRKADVVITTAQVPGKKAPILVTEDMVNQMKPGAVVVDLAAEQGGNCAFTEPGKNINHNGVTILGTLNLPASVPTNASQVYAKNLQTLVQYIIKNDMLNLDFEDDIINDSCITHNGEIRNQKVKDALAVAV